MRRRWKRNIAKLLVVSMIFVNIPVYGAAPARAAGGLCEHHPEHTEDCGYRSGTTGTPCSHEHTEDCYTLVENCVHEHKADCYPEESGSEDTATPSEADKAEPTECNHVCSEENGCITEELDCQHEHNEEDCGYSPAEPGTPCTYVCEICYPQGGDHPGTTKPEEEPKTDADACVCITACTKESINEGCPVCSADGADLSDCKGANVSTPSDALKITPEQVQEMIDALPTEEELQAMTPEEQNKIYADLQAAYDAYESLTDAQKAEITGEEVFENLFAVFNGMINALDTVGAFEVTGGTVGTDYSYSDGVLTVNDGANITISMADGATTPTNDRIVVNGEAEITLNGVNITGAEYSMMPHNLPQSPIDLSENTILTLNLADTSTNVLTGGSDVNFSSECGAPGIHVPETATLIIQGTGTLTVTGGNSSAIYGGVGIGGNAGASSNQSGETCGTVVVLASGRLTISAGSGYPGSSSNDIGGGKSPSHHGGNGAGIRPVPDKDNTYEVWGELTLPEGVTIPESATLTGSGTLAEGSRVEQSAPSAPTLNTSTSNSVTLNAPSDAIEEKMLEYGYTTGNQSINTITWTPNPTFAGLSQGVTYTFYARYVGDGKFYQASPASEGLSVILENNSQVTLSITGSGVVVNNGAYYAVYGASITVTADIAAASTGTKTCAAAKNTVDFYLGSIADGNKLNGQPIAVIDNKATLTLTLTGEKWNAGTTPYTILAEFGGSDALKESSGTAQLTITPAPIVGMISITGDAVLGGTLTANYTSLTGETVSYQWKRDSENIPGATEATYVVADSDVGKKITVTVTASDANHTGELTSASVTVGQAAQLAAPQNVVLESAKPGSAAVSWSAVANVQSYSVQLYKGGQPQGSPVSVKDGTAHTFENITEAGSYMVRVIAKGTGNFADSQEAESSTLSFYPVTFETDGGSSMSRQIVAAGGKVEKPNDPIKTNYAFSGWYRENSFSVSWNFDADTVSQAVTLYAKWTKTEDSGGSGDSSSSGGSSGGTSAGSGGSSSSSSSSASVYVPKNGTWKADETGWRFEKKEGGYPADTWYECVWNGKKYWYHFNAAGYLDSGWFTDNDGATYYLHNQHDNQFGYMYTGWHWIEGKCYYFTPNTIAGGAKQGMLYKNGTTPDGYSVNETGAWMVNGAVQMKYYFLIQ